MDKTMRRLIEIAGHLDAISEQIRVDSRIPMKSALIGFHADEIKELAEEINELVFPLIKS